MLNILYETDDLVAIHKPHGLLVHRSFIARDVSEFAVQKLRDQIGQKVYPVHRLDRKTAGVLLFAKNREVATQMHTLFLEKQVNKEYLAVVRGYTEEAGTIDYPLVQDGKTKEAITHFERLQTFELPVPFGNFSTARYSLLRLVPETGRFHQIRKHLAHIFHPIIGDRPHGCNKQNRFWKERFNFTQMLLLAHRLSWQTSNGSMVSIVSPESEPFTRALQILLPYSTKQVPN